MDDIDPQCTVETLQSRIQQAISVRPDEQQLIFAGKRLDNNKRTLLDCNITENCQVCVAVCWCAAPSAKFAVSFSNVVRVHNATACCGDGDTLAVLDDDTEFMIQA